jgi:DNA-binding MarR family transcriptional regulator
MSDGRAMAYGPLRDSLGFLLRLSQLRSFGLFFARFEETGVRPGELSVLVMIAENAGVRQGVLAKALRIKRAHMTKMIHGMEAQGLVTRTVPEDDKRSVELWLTEEGKALVARLLPILDLHEATAPDRLTPEEAQLLKQLLRKYLALGGEAA